ncbi:DNA repair protein [Dyadobacter sp. CY261]|uniref:DNA-3-methyladenine glycosylase family protein n=1 Tax=Dyadobacter sp. CY261 TaxID=2907203 RepID=UPI001F429C83|nr:DNA glycosylase [Dyadobacter sp. CY261]MCF0069920.1 DNA repair protein [Dyadobacter sp. CY261]
MDHPTILIPVPPFFSFQECLWFLNRNYDDCLHVISDNAIWKAIQTPFGDVLFHIQEHGGFLEIETLAGPANPECRDFLTSFVKEWFDLERDIQPFYAHLKRDKRLAYMADDFTGLRLIGISDMFEALCWCIIGQQINLTFAYKLKRRLVERFGRHLEWDNQVFYIFPDAETLANAEVDELRAMQFSEKKAQYISGIARAFVAGMLSKEGIAALPDFPAQQKALTSHKGIGIWTANYALMKSLRVPQGIPHGDVGLLNALVAHGIIADRTEKDKINAFFGAFAGWETYLAFYLWRSLAVKALV